MNLIKTALTALDFHMFDREGHELTLWHHSDERETPAHEAAIRHLELQQGAAPEMQSQSV